LLIPIDNTEFVYKEIQGKETLMEYSQSHVVTYIEYQGRLQQKAMGKEVNKFFKQKTK
jgi:hypothetical protein